MILLKNCFSILAADGTKLSGHDLLIKENRIEKLDKAIDPGSLGTETIDTIDCSQLVCVPGFINTHTHEGIWEESMIILVPVVIKLLCLP